ncbi:MAG TPA: hypothetical protein VH329_01280 [Solirubrobacterales bacterium]|jgi:hypothetical protein
MRAASTVEAPMTTPAAAAAVRSVAPIAATVAAGALPIEPSGSMPIAPIEKSSRAASVGPAGSPKPIRTTQVRASAVAVNARTIAISRPRA